MLSSDNNKCPTAKRTHMMKELFKYLTTLQEEVVNLAVGRAKGRDYNRRKKKKSPGSLTTKKISSLWEDIEKK